MPAEKIRMLNQVADTLHGVPNVVAIVLGGSYASGLARSDSDLDIGLYYREASPFSISDVWSVAETISTSGSVPVVTGMYEWGPWVNGGAWIKTPAGQVDFVYRNLDQVQTVIDEGHRGVWRHDYDQQPPYGFRSIVYFGEIRICVPLYDPEGEIARLKQLVSEYPEALRDRIVQDSLWGAEFSLMFCRSFCDRADVCNAVGCMTRVAQFLIHTLFALNKQYFVSDKSANRLIDNFPVQPRDFTSRLAGVLASPGSNYMELSRSVELLSALWLETVDLTVGTYNPRWRSAQDKFAL
jgi:predicted nucleotidyltransferase